MSNRLTLSSELLLVLEDRPLSFPLIRDILKKVSGQENRKVIWSTLERLVKRGHLKKIRTKEGIQFALTKEGQKKKPKEPTFIERPQRAWDKKWVVVALEISKKKKELISGLKEMGFGRLGNNLYISVHDVFEKVKDLVKNSSLSQEVRIMKVEELAVSDEKELAKKIWNLEGLNKRYKEFIEKNKEGLKADSLNSHTLRYWLKKTRYEYLTILHDDPILPKELLPSDWQGYEAESVFKKLEDIWLTY